MAPITSVPIKKLDNGYPLAKLTGVENQHILYMNISCLIMLLCTYTYKTPLSPLPLSLTHTHTQTPLFLSLSLQYEPTLPHKHLSTHKHMYI